jgi:hypothetical protein
MKAFNISQGIPYHIIHSFINSLNILPITSKESNSQNCVYALLGCFFLVCDGILTIKFVKKIHSLDICKNNSSKPYYKIDNIETSMHIKKTV